MSNIVRIAPVPAKGSVSALEAARQRAGERVLDARRGQVEWLAGVWRRDVDAALAAGLDGCTLSHGCDREGWAQLAADLVVLSLVKEGLRASRRGFVVTFDGGP